MKAISRLLGRNWKLALGQRPVDSSSIRAVFVFHVKNLNEIKETKEKKKDKFWLYPDIVRKYISEARNRVPFRRTRWQRRCEVF